MALELTQRAQRLEAMHPTEQAINDLARDVNLAEITSAQKECILQIINRAWLNVRENEPEVRPPIPALTEALITDTTTAALNRTAFLPQELAPFSHAAAEQPTPRQVQVINQEEAPFQNLARIWHTFLAGLQYLVSFIMSYVFCLPASLSPTPLQRNGQLIAQQPSPVPQQRAVPSPVEEQSTPPMAPIQEQPLVTLQVPPPAQEQPQGSLEVLSQVQQPVAAPLQAAAFELAEEPVISPQNIQPGIYQGNAVVDHRNIKTKTCLTFAVLKTFWELVDRNISTDRYPYYIDHALRVGLSKDNEVGGLRELFQNIEQGHKYFGDSYQHNLQLMENNARHTGICAAVLSKGLERHALFVKNFDRNYIYYHINLENYPVKVSVFNSFEQFLEYLNQEIPLEKETPFQMHPHRVVYRT